ncbi:MAG: hypothetical protein DI536_04215 [Archangium gephyra]|uniref:Peptidase n=1 Tax=Archangium gephyra TaxID=48 RepID=A0A2W5VP32_9BACT|nr:MAG: hypothetical protein DI536_04215 [Archangium gephyra]
MNAATKTTTTSSSSSDGSGNSNTTNSDTLGDALKGADGKGADTTKTDGAGGTTTTQTDGKAPDGKAADAKPTPIELKLPDGFKADEKQLAGFKTLAAELGLDSAKAQKLFDQHLADSAAANKAATEAARAEYAKQVETWKAQTQADPDIGGEKWATSQQELIRAVQNPAMRELASVFRELGHGDHPKVVKALVHIGRALKDDSVKGTATPAEKKPQAKSDAEIF